MMKDKQKYIYKVGLYCPEIGYKIYRYTDKVDDWNIIDTFICTVLYNVNSLRWVIPITEDDIERESKKLAKELCKLLNRE